MYDFWQFLHVMSAAIWVGAAALALFLSFRLGAAQNDPAAFSASRLLETTSVPLFIIASMATFITGLIMAFGWIGFGPLWIKIGLGGILISMVMGFGYFKPQIAKLEAAISERGATDAGVQAKIRQMNMVAAAELVVFFVIIWAMVTKP